MSKRALITGVTGQDGYYLAKFLLSKGYKVVGQTRNASQANQSMSDLPISIISFDLRSFEGWSQIIEEYQLDEIYHLAGVSYVPTSWTSPNETIAANTEVTIHILESIRLVCPSPRFFYACSSEVFGKPSFAPQSEVTPFRPINPYGVSKAASFGLIESFRERYGLYACSGILFNHESPRRDHNFVIRKITKGVAAIRMGMQDRLNLGNIDVARDWGYAGDYVECMHRMLQGKVAQDFVIGTGRLIKLEQIVDVAFHLVGLDWRNWVSIDPSLVRANDTRTLVANCSKAWNVLRWKAETRFEHVIGMMVEHDLRALQCRSEIAA